MKIALIGYGKMGQMIEKGAIKRGHSVVARVSSPSWNQADLNDADLCMEFTNPESALSNIEKAASFNKSLVIGTTGWFDKVDELHELVEKYQIGALYGPNFSIGVGLMMNFVDYMSLVMNFFEEYDVGGIELHHAAKKDSPSGTAGELARIIANNIERKKEMAFSSVRCGSEPGTHSVFFDSPEDTITLTHAARSREGFAKGAVLAGEWLRGKKGVYTFTDCIDDIMQGRIL